MLVNQQDPNILSLISESLESFLDCRIVGLAVNDKEVLL